MRRFDKHIPIEKIIKRRRTAADLSGFGDRACLWLIVAHLGTHRDSKAVPGVDGGQGKHQRNQLRFVEVRSCALEDRVGHMTFCDPGDGLGKRERRAFALGVKRRLLPHVQHVEFLLGLAEGAGVFRMCVEAIRAPIDVVPQKAGQIFFSVSSSIPGSFLVPFSTPQKCG
jgi:hypothetical protein